ncbi:MAG TPA: NHL repeat-containing protein [Thermomicrobiales bacterium]|nr:NHL repeat-containing protein [Thermomicrobiales bacterium]
MDSTRFDRLARALAAGTRRRFLAGLLAAAAPAVAAAPQPAQARQGHGGGSCKDAGDCGNGEACLGGTCVAVVVPNGGAGGGTVTAPYALAAGGGRLFVTDVFGADDHVRIFALSAASGQLTSTGTFHDSYSFALGIALDAAGRVYVASNAGIRVYAVAADGSQRLLADIRGIPRPIGVAAAGRFLFVASNRDNSVRTFRILESDPPTYQLIATVDDFRSPEHLAADDGRLYVADTGNDRVQVYGIDASSGQLAFQRTIAVPNPHGVGVGGGQLFVSSPGRDRVRVYDLAADGTPSLETVLTKGEQKLIDPHGLAVSGRFLFVANTNNSRIEGFRIL